MDGMDEWMELDDTTIIERSKRDLVQAGIYNVHKIECLPAEDFSSTTVLISLNLRHDRNNKIVFICLCCIFN